MNRHPLTDDMRMYYAGTYIFRNAKDGTIEAMLVDGTERIGDDTLFDGFDFIGHVYTSDLNKEATYGRFNGTDLIEYRPFSGYYNLGGKAKKYVTFAVNNRSQRKGIDSRNVLIGNRAAGLTGQQMVMIYEQSQAMCSNPASRDIYISGTKVHWKGNEVGTLTDGKFEANETHKQVEGLVCRLLQNI